ncbi:P-loop containing nucleoside triphosphate hydrolase protein, partial [Mycena sanguinolenta]
LPSKPKIFYGRETELHDIMKILLDQPAPRIAILGGGGMGKTSLARAVLHHPDTPTKFEQRLFVSAEPATSSIELAALIGLHIGLNLGKDLTKAVVQYFSERPPCLLILDNLETVWEPLQSRGVLEEFLSLLTDVKHLGLMITMRGTERPAKVQWTRLFLLSLQPLSDNAAQQTFMDVTDGSYAIEDFGQLLSFTDNMPLAVDLLAHLVDYEGLESVKTRWETEKTSILSLGYDRKSNLNASINLSVSSPRITSDSKDLLSLLSILPDGLSDAELVQSELPISNILSCKAILLATSSAYQSSNKRLLVLMPVREHIQQVLPLSPSLVHCLQKHFYALLKLYMKCKGE